MALTATYRGHVDGSSTGVAVSGPISVLAGDALVVAVVADSWRDITQCAVSLSTGWGFPYRVDHGFWGNTSDGVYVGIFAAVPLPANGSPTITVTTSGSAQGFRRPSFDIWSISGQDGSVPVLRTDYRDTYGNPMELNLPSGASAGDTIAIIVGGDGASAGTPFVSGSGINPGNGFTQPSGGGEPGICGFSTAANWATPNTPQQLFIDPAGSSMAFQTVAWMEFQGARIPPVVSAGADASHTFGTGAFNRTAGETANGVISAREWKIVSGPVGAGTVIGTAQALSWTPTVAGAYVLRYSSTNAFGTASDDATITVVGVVPTVGAGADRNVDRTQGLIRTASEPSNGGSTITGRQWRLMSGPGGSGAPVDLPAYGGDPMRVLLPNTVLGAHVIRYTATNATGSGFDEATITVVGLRPTVNAGPDEARGAGLFTRTAQETAGDAPITAREWKVMEGPTAVGTVIGTAATLSWTPPTLGRWVLRYTATSSMGSSVPDDCVIQVGVTGIPMNIDYTPVPRLAFSIAFAGDLTDVDGSSWAFTEVSEDVRIKNGMHIKHGRSDEASVSQPATCTFTLDNRSGKYSLGGGSPYWPNVRQGTPVKVEIDLGEGAGFQTIFIGYADGFTPEYSINPLDPLRSSGDATVSVSASGAMRRLAQGQPPDVSPLRRGLTNSTGVRAYWPCEDEKNSQFLASAFPNHAPMTYSGRFHGGSNPGLAPAVPNLGASTEFDCSAPLPLVADSEWYGDVVSYTTTGIIQLRCLIAVPDSGSNDHSVIIGVITTGDPGFWELRYMTGGYINVRAWRNFQSLVLDTGPIALVPGPSGPSVGFVGIDGNPGQLGLTLQKIGANIDWTVDYIRQGNTIGYVYGPGMGGPVVPGASVGRPLRIQTATDGGHVGVTLGHVVARSDARDTAVHVEHLNAYSGEIVGARLLRLATENLLPYAQPDGDVHVVTVTDRMGPQRRATVLELFRDCETCDQGILWDGISPGLTYTTKRYRESRPPKMVLEATTGEVGYPFAPMHDDANRRNRVTATRTGGSSAIYEDVTGTLGSHVIGRYDDSIGVNVDKDSSAQYYAGWRVHTGTVEGYRWPRLTINLRRNPHLIADWLTVICGDRIDVINTSVVNRSAPNEPISLGVEGYEQSFGDSTWTVTLNCSP